MTIGFRFIYVGARQNASFLKRSLQQRVFLRISYGATTNQRSHCDIRLDAYLINPPSLVDWTIQDLRLSHLLECHSLERVQLLVEFSPMLGLKLPRPIRDDVDPSLIESIVDIVQYHKIAMYEMAGLFSSHYLKFIRCIGSMWQ